jgi:hypothetical protein
MGLRPGGSIQIAPAQLVAKHGALVQPSGLPSRARRSASSPSAGSSRPTAPRSSRNGRPCDARDRRPVLTTLCIRAGTQRELGARGRLDWLPGLCPSWTSTVPADRGQERARRASRRRPQSRLTHGDPAGRHR